MSYTLAVLDRGTDNDNDGLLEKNIDDISDIDIENLVYLPLKRVVVNIG